MRTPLCDALGIEHPIVSAPMGPDLAGPELVAAVSGAGGLGVLQAQFAPPEALREQIREIRSRTAKPFGVSAILHFPCDPIVEICLEERVPVLWFFWGDPAKYVAPAHAAGDEGVPPVRLGRGGAERGARGGRRGGRAGLAKPAATCAGPCRPWCWCRAWSTRRAHARDRVGRDRRRARPRRGAGARRASRRAGHALPGQPRVARASALQGAAWSRRPSRTPRSRRSSVSAGPTRRTARCARRSSRSGSATRRAGRSAGPTTPSSAGRWWPDAHSRCASSSASRPTATPAATSSRWACSRGSASARSTRSCPPRRSCASSWRSAERLERALRGG